MKTVNKQSKKTAFINSQFSILTDLCKKLPRKEFKELLQSLKESLDLNFGLLIEIWKDDACEKYQRSNSSEIISLITTIIDDLKLKVSIDEKIHSILFLCDLINNEFETLQVELFGMRKDAIKGYELAMEALTLEQAQTLIGQTILWNYPSYNPRSYLRITTIGSLINEWDYIKDNVYNEYMTQGERLISQQSRYIEQAKKTTCILDDKGRDTYMRELGSKMYDDPVFTCSDLTRVVSFLQLNDI